MLPAAAAGYYDMFFVVASLFFFLFTIFYTSDPVVFIEQTFLFCSYSTKTVVVGLLCQHAGEEHKGITVRDEIL